MVINVVMDSGGMGEGCSGLFYVLFRLSTN